MVEIIGGASTTSRNPERMLTGLRAIKSHGNKVLLEDEIWRRDWQGGLAGPIFGYAPDWWIDALSDAALHGPVSSIAHQDERIVAEMLVSMYPDIDAVRWMTNGSDPNTAAVKLARAVTGRDRILVFGYHGTGSMFCTPPEVHARPGLGTIDARLGTLQAERDAFIPLGWLEEHVETDKSGTVLWDPRLDLTSLSVGNNFAAVVIECPPVDGGREIASAWLQHLADWTHEMGALFILDEVVTGFRYGPGGAAEYYGLTGKVDLYCFGKTLGNAYPIAALAGRRNVMKALVDWQGVGRVHFSGTFFGDGIGLAAAKATLRQLQEHPPWPHLYDTGEYLIRRWNNLDLPWKLAGHPTRPIIHPDPAPDDEQWLSLRRYLFNHGHIAVDHPWYITTETTLEDIEDLRDKAELWQNGR